MRALKSSIVTASTLAAIFVVVGTIWAVRPVDPPPPLDTSAAPALPQGRGALAPAIRWRIDSTAEIPEVQIDGTWYELQKLRDKPIAEILAYAKTSFGNDWQRRFQEDL